MDIHDIIIAATWAMIFVTWILLWRGHFHGSAIRRRIRQLQVENTRMRVERERDIALVVNAVEVTGVALSVAANWEANRPEAKPSHREQTPRTDHVEDVILGVVVVNPSTLPGGRTEGEPAPSPSVPPNHTTP